MARRRRSAALSGGPTILDLFDEPSAFGKWFSGPSWAAWRAFLAALFGLPMSAAEAAIVRACTGRQRLPSTPARKAWLIAGRRSGKSRIAAAVAVFLACFRDYSAILAPGERGVVMLIAADKRQAGVLMGYVIGLLDGVPMLAGLVQRRAEEWVRLKNRINLEIHVSSFRSTRGYTTVAAVADEIAYWRSEETNSDTEVVNALLGGMGTLPGRLLLCLSSPYARKGALWQAYKHHWARDDDPELVWRADTKTMHPTFDDEVIASAYLADESAARADYGSEFRSDLEDFVGRDVIEAAVVSGRHELPPMSGRWPPYQAFCDPASGSGADSMALGIGHLEKAAAVLDLLHVVDPPFNFEEVVGEFSAVLKAYKVRKVVGDSWAKGWPAKEFSTHGITYEIADQRKSDIYLELLPALTSRRVELLDDPKLMRQLLGLERRRGFAGVDKVDHGPGPKDHDDGINAAAGALVLAWGKRRRGSPIRMGGVIRVSPSDAELEAAEATARMAELLDPLRRRS